VPLAAANLLMFACSRSRSHRRYWAASAADERHRPRRGQLTCHRRERARAARRNSKAQGRASDVQHDAAAWKRAPKAAAIADCRMQERPDNAGGICNARRSKLAPSSPHQQTPANRSSTKRAKRKASPKPSLENFISPLSLSAHRGTARSHSGITWACPPTEEKRRPQRSTGSRARTRPLCRRPAPRPPQAPRRTRTRHRLTPTATG
jgi:hypothetical protein